MKAYARPIARQEKTKNLSIRYDVSKNNVCFEATHRLSHLIKSISFISITLERLFMNTTHRDTKAWEAGLKSAEKGQPLNKCPHERNSIQAKSWEAGYAEGLAKKKENKDS